MHWRVTVWPLYIYRCAFSISGGFALIYKSSAPTSRHRASHPLDVTLYMPFISHRDRLRQFDCSIRERMVVLKTTKSNVMMGTYDLRRGLTPLVVHGRQISRWTPWPPLLYIGPTLSPTLTYHKQSIGHRLADRREFSKVGVAPCKFPITNLIYCIAPPNPIYDITRTAEMNNESAYFTLMTILLNFVVRSIRHLLASWPIYKNRMKKEKNMS